MEVLKTVGGIEDVATIGFFLLLMGVMALLGWYFADTFMTGIETINIPGAGNLTTIAPNLHAQSVNAFGFMDSLSAVVLALLIIGSLALAFYSRGHPYLAAIAVFIQIFYLIGGIFVKMFWEGISTATPELEAVALAHFPTTNLVLTSMPIIAFVTLIGIIILFFTRSSEEQAMGY